ncbi:hypothetical protein [Microseira sp. BLCC-F43]|uniref:hypothetical protein n=1 Tax=Microseira sp. BLCC-F43 TaxID=3153602 RepID=UPI0035BA6225
MRVNPGLVDWDGFMLSFFFHTGIAGVAIALCYFMYAATADIMSGSSPIVRNDLGER